MIGSRESRIGAVGLTAWVVAGLVVVTPPVLLMWTDGLDPGTTFQEILGSISFLLVGPVYAITSAMIVSRQPRNGVGWMLMVVAVGMVLGIAYEAFIPSEPPTDPSLWLIVLLGLASASWVFFIYPIFHLLLTFPTGRVLSRRWRPLVVLEVVMVAFMLVSGVFAETVPSVDGSWSLDNPIGFVPESLFGPIFEVLWNTSLYALTFAALLSIILRYRRARSIERLQVKWLLYAVIFFALVYGGLALSSDPEQAGLLDVLLPVAVIGIGVAIAIALLRYRLYDIDRVISRTVTYALVVGLLAAVFAGLITLVGTQVSEEPIFVAAATLGVASLFNPLRRRVQTGVERRFNRSRYDVERVMSAFTLGLREPMDPDALVDGWRDVVVDTMQPSSLGLWVRL